MRVERCFAFVDLTGFTSFTEHYGDERTVVVLAAFRTRVREIAARRGVRVTKWLGDGAMLSSGNTDAVVGMVMELACITPEAVPLEIRAGLAQGPVIMFEGDDYIGRATNVASRLCDVADSGVTATIRTCSSGLRATSWIESTAPSEATQSRGRSFSLSAFRAYSIDEIAAVSSSPATTMRLSSVGTPWISSTSASTR